MIEAIEYANSVTFLPLHPIDDNYDKLLALWGRIRSRDLARIFWECDDYELTQRAFLGYMQAASIVMLGFTQQEIACAWWLSNMHGEGGTSRCELSGWFPFASRGVGSEHLLRKVLAWIHETLGIQSVFMRSPWRTVHALCERAELATVAEIERYYIRGKPETLRIFRSE
jgi:hypothetical protein